MKKRLAVFLLVAVMALVLSGCYCTLEMMSISTGTTTVKGREFRTTTEELNLSGNDLKNPDIKPLKQMALLTRLDLQNNQISNISALKNLKNLTCLDLSGNQISDISALKSLKRLTVLNLGGNPISDLSALKNLKKLTELTLNIDQVSEKQINELKAALPNCQISTTITIKDREFSTDLTSLSLSGQSLTDSDIKSLKYMTNLTYLDLSGNPISDLSALKNLKKLSKLTLSIDQISGEQINEFKAALPNCQISTMLGGGNSDPWGAHFRRTLTAFNENFIYMTTANWYEPNYNDNSVYVIDTISMKETKLEFPHTPTSLFCHENELLIGFGNEGLVLILDAQTMQEKQRFYTGNSFYYAAIGKDGFVYTVDYYHMRGFSRVTERETSISFTYAFDALPVPHPVFNRFYCATEFQSPQDIKTVHYNNGIIESTYDSPYHGHYPDGSWVMIGAKIRISPDGANIFASAGDVFLSDSSRDKDMLFKDRFTPFVDLVFDLPNNRMIASKETSGLYIYDYKTYEQIGQIETAFPVIAMSLSGNKIIAVSQNGASYYLEIFDLN